MTYDEVTQGYCALEVSFETECIIQIDALLTYLPTYFTFVRYYKILNRLYRRRCYVGK